MKTYKTAGKKRCNAVDNTEGLFDPLLFWLEHAKMLRAIFDSVLMYCSYELRLTNSDPIRDYGNLQFIVSIRLDSTSALHRR